METFIIGSGVCLPERVVSNEELADQLGLQADYMYKFSGIRRRHWATQGTTTSSLASNALRMALQDAGLIANELDYLFFGTMTPDRFIPGSASAVQKDVALREIPCLDIRAACCNALYGLQLSFALIKSGVARCVGMCLAEIQSPSLELSPEAGKISMLFGDGASALIVSDNSSNAFLKVLDVVLATDGKHIDDLGIRRPGTELGTYGDLEDAGEANWHPRMSGQSIILNALRRMSEACRLILERNAISIGDVRWLVPHQANANLLDQLARNLEFRNLRDGVVSVLEESGNTSSASMGMALDKLRRSRLAQPGDIVLLPAFGAGFSWGAALCQAL